MRGAYEDKYEEFCRELTEPGCGCEVTVTIRSKDGSTVEFTCLDGGVRAESAASSVINSFAFEKLRVVDHIMQLRVTAREYTIKQSPAPIEDQPKGKQ